jgi:hypothetical protein
MVRWVDALVLVVAGCLSSCGCKGDDARPGNPPVSTEASAISASASFELGPPDTAPLDAASLHAQGSTDAAQSPPIPAVDKRDLAKLKACCRTFEKMGQATHSDEGAGLVGLAGMCEEFAESLAHGEASEPDWATIRLILENFRAPGNCNNVLLKYEKK